MPPRLKRVKPVVYRIYSTPFYLPCSPKYVNVRRWFFETTNRIKIQIGTSPQSLSVRNPTCILAVAIAAAAAALLFDGDERPLAVDDLPVENVVADDEDGGVLRGVVVKVAHKLPAEGHVSDPGLEVTLKRQVG